MTKEIVLLRMYSGEYLNENIGHEIINLFKTDNGKHFIYLNEYGSFSMEHLSEGKLCFDNIILGVSVPNSNAMEVLGLAKGLKMIYNPYLNSTENTKVQYDVADTILYSGKSLLQIHNKPSLKDCFITFEAEKVLRPNRRIIIKYADKKNTKRNNPNYDCDVFISLKDTRQRSLKNYVKDSSVDYTSLLSLIDNKTLWEDNITKINIEKVTKINLLEICRKQYDELVYSNMFAYFSEKYPEFVKKFAKEHLCTVDNDIVFDDLHVLREKEHTDILLYGKNYLAVIENKIKANLSDLQYDKNNKVISSQMDKYKTVIKSKTLEELGLKNVSPKFFLLLPDYHSLRFHTEEKTKLVKGMEQKYQLVQDCEVIWYSTVYEFLKEEIKKQPYNNDTSFVEFVGALEIHSHKYDNGTYTEMLRRFTQKIKQAQ
ncbi:MAG: PD-(D/E)XK nuclease family protein [Bacteroidales bacterium]|nr:PD-(D/E)XK nuclease family protein [Bacteroidales bacterium]